MLKSDDPQSAAQVRRITWNKADSIASGTSTTQCYLNVQYLYKYIYICIYVTQFYHMI